MKKLKFPEFSLNPWRVGKYGYLSQGNALVRNDCKTEILCTFSNWLNTWQDSKKLGLSQQTFKALIQTNFAISEFSLEFLNKGHEYVLTGHLQSDHYSECFHNIGS